MGTTHTRNRAPCVVCVSSYDSRFLFSSVSKLLKPINFPGRDPVATLKRPWVFQLSTLIYIARKEGELKYLLTTNKTVNLVLPFFPHLPSKGIPSDRPTRTHTASGSASRRPLNSIQSFNSIARLPPLTGQLTAAAAAAITSEAHLIRGAYLVSAGKME